MALAEHDQPVGQFNAPGEPLMEGARSAPAATEAAEQLSWATVNRRALLLTAGALLLAALGQYYFAARPDYMWDGVLFYLFAVVCFVGALRSLRPAGDRPPAAAPPAEATAEAGAGPRLSPGAVLSGLTAATESRLRLLFALAAIWCSLLAAYLANLNAESYWGPFWLWLIGWVAFTAAFAIGARPLTWSEAAARLRAWADAHRLELIVVGGILLLALLARVINLEPYALNFGGDEGTQGTWALDAMNGRLKNMFATGWFDVPTMQFFIVGAFLRIAGASVAGLRLMYALLGTLSVLFTYLLVRDVWRDRWLAALAAFILATANYHLHFSRLGSHQISDAFFITLVLWLYVRAERSGSLLTYALCGLALGFSSFFYYGARIIGVILGVYILYRAAAGLAARIRRGEWTNADRRVALQSAAGIAVMLSAAGLVLAPLAVYYVQNPAKFTSRAEQVSIFAPGWLDQAAAFFHLSKVQVIGEQFRKAFSAFNYWPDPTFWYHPDRPLLDAVSGVLLVFGVTYSLTRLRQRPYWLVVTWFFLAVTFAWALTENPPSSMRGLVVTPAVAILAAVGLQQVFRLARHTWGEVTWAALPVALFAIAYLNFNFYFGEYIPKTEWGFLASQVATRLARTLEQRTDDYTVYMFSSGEIYWGDNGVLHYMLYGVPGMDINQPLNGPPTFVDPSRGAAFVFLPSRRNDLQWVRQAFPNGRLQDFSNSGGQLVFTLYEVSSP